MAELATTAVPTPPHAYVPGANGRHPEGWFDALKSDVADINNPADLHLSQAWAAGLIYLEQGYYWECHEVLEAVWLRTPERSAEREMVQALIQLANARLKLKMNRPKAAARLCDMVEAHLALCSTEWPTLGLSRAAVLGWVAETKDRVT